MTTIATCCRPRSPALSAAPWSGRRSARVNGPLSLPSRGAMTCDGQFVVVGSYNVKDTEISAQAQVLEVNKLTLSQPLQQSSSLSRLLEVENNLAWLSARQMDAKFAVAENTFVAASAGLKLDAYE